MASTTRTRGFYCVVLASALACLPACARNTPAVTTPASQPVAVTPAMPAPPPAATPATPATAAAAAGVAAQPSATPAPRPPAVPPLVGHITHGDLKDYAPWQTVLTQAYVPDPAAVTSIRSAPSDVTVLAIVATWCPDTKRELPRVFAIMEAAGLPESMMTMVGVDRTKKDAEGLTEKWAVTRVPTFIFLRNGLEVGRVTERVAPETTLEREIARIVSSRTP